MIIIIKQGAQKSQVDTTIPMVQVPTTTPREPPEC